MLAYETIIYWMFSFNLLIFNFLSFLKKKYYRKFKYKRLNLKKGEAILFDPNLIHGGTDNLGTKTRVSLEFRLYNHKNILVSKNRKERDSFFKRGTDSSLQEI